MRILLLLALATCGLACEKRIHEARDVQWVHTSGATRSTAATVGLRYSAPK